MIDDIHLLIEKKNKIQMIDKTIESTYIDLLNRIFQDQYRDQERPE